MPGNIYKTPRLQKRGVFLIQQLGHQTFVGAAYALAYALAAFCNTITIKLSGIGMINVQKEIKIGQIMINGVSATLRTIPTIKVRIIQINTDFWTY